MLHACCVVSDNHKKGIKNFIKNFNERPTLPCALQIQLQKHFHFGIIDEKYPWIDPENIRFFFCLIRPLRKNRSFIKTAERNKHHVTGNMPSRPTEKELKRVAKDGDFYANKRHFNMSNYTEVQLKYYTKKVPSISYSVTYKTIDKREDILEHL
jgi:hypothetical protein